jgi:hypothetical protein
MRAPRRATPCVEGIESKALLSGVPAVAPMIFPPPVLVTGHAEGAALIYPDTPDAGTRYVLLGTGEMGEMGRVFVQGEIQTSSSSGRPIGTVTLESEFGSVVLEIMDRPSPAVPDVFLFVVSSATGRFEHLEGAGGVLELRVNAAGNTGTFEMDVNPFIILSGGGD